MNVHSFQSTWNASGPPAAVLSVSDRNVGSRWLLCAIKRSACGVLAQSQILAKQLGVRDQLIAKVEPLPGTRP